MNPEQLVAHLKKLTQALSAKQLLGLGLVFLAVVGVVVTSAYWISTPDYTLLVADMDSETASAVVGKLKASKISYQLGDGGRSVSVPAERVDELRLQFGSGGLPSSGRLGFEIFDRPAFGTTEFLEHVNYRRALEGELARTIGTLSEVASARVHIAMAKDSLFVEQEQPAKASVVLRLKANRPLQPATVKGIAGLVSASVESLRPELVTILDTYGRFLSRPEDSGAAGGTAQFERQQQVERDLATRVVALLEPAVGTGRVRVNVAAVLNADVTELTEERYDPAAVVRSRQTSAEIAAGAASGAGGVAGARANLPPPLSTAAAASGAPAATGAATTTANAADPAATSKPVQTVAGNPLTGAGRSSETTNYEVSRSTRHTVLGLGQISRLSVAVIVDDQRVPAKSGAAGEASVKPRDPAEIQRLQSLVAAAVGLDTKRGDLLTIENMSFETTPVEPEPVAPGIGSQVMDGVKQYWPSALRMIGVLLVALFALFGILRPLGRRATAMAAPALPTPAVAAARLPTISEMEGHLDEGPAFGGQRRLPVLTKRVAKLANEEPEQLARIVRGWMAEDHR